MRFAASHGQFQTNSEIREAPLTRPPRSAGPKSTTCSEDRPLREGSGLDMATAKPPRTSTLPPLENGDQLDQKTFHARYQAMPEDCRAELIGGIVYMPSPQKVPHSKARQLVVRWLDE